MSVVVLAVLGSAWAAAPRSVSAGEVQRLVEAQRGVTVVHVWASWCGPCRSTFEPLNELAATDRARGLEVVAVSIDDDCGKLDRYLKGRTPSWTNLHLRGEKVELARSLAELGGRWNGSVPYELVIDADGRAVAQWSGALGDDDLLKRKIRKHLPEAPVGGATLTPSAADLAAVQQGTVHIVLAGREGEPVWIDGWQAGVLPLDTELISGEHTFRVGEDDPVEVRTVVSFDGGSPTIDLGSTPGS